MTTEEIVNELIRDYKEILFGLEYENLDLKTEEYKKVLRCALYFSNQMIVNCIYQEQKRYLLVIELLNKKLSECETLK